jgi:uracil-DNA glycosylase family 4
VTYPDGVDPASLQSLEQVNRLVAECRACPRLVEWREQVAQEKRAAFADWQYWGRAVPGFGDPAASIVIVGLAPAAHGANRTGRMFTGDRSGDFLYAALHRAGLANQPTSVARDDGLRLSGVWITAPVRCAPPANKPTPAERDRCRPWFEADLRLVPWRVAVVLGSFGYAALARTVGLRPRPKFAHGLEVELGDGRWLVGSFHVSQQNTFTGKLTPDMFDTVLGRAIALATP